MKWPAASAILVNMDSAGEVSREFDPREYLREVTRLPGVYRMYNEHDDIIYVGKASNLRNRLSSYFQKNLDSPKTRALVAQISRVETTVTASPAEALILEHNLIKEHRPRYNVLLRDDKSYPYVYINTRHEFPRISYQRNSRRAPGKYIGPYPNASAVKKSLRLVQKLFRVRQCEDSYYRNRSRPCLQYQIQRCSGPCVGLVDQQQYRDDVEMTIRVLEGKSHDVLKDLASQMDKASEQLDFERAALLRDQIRDLKATNDLSNPFRNQGNADYVAVELQGGVSCVQIFLVRNGINLGNKVFFPATPAGSTTRDILDAFLPQFYFEHEVPNEIIVSEEPSDASLLEDVLSQRTQTHVSISWRVRTDRAKLLQLARTNAEIALGAKLSSRSSMAARLDALRQLVDLEDLPQRMECFDISHTMGEATVASCVVFGVEGAMKSEYRRFNIEDITGGDDYAAMRQALTRRYTRLLKENRPVPDLLFIDGGKGQVGVALSVLEELQITDMQVVGVSKGPDRRPGDETLLLCNQGVEVQLGNDSPALLLIQQIRDEAHRFAIAGHRGRRAKKRKRSVLEDIRGLGPQRRKALLTHFGGLQGIQKASIDDLAGVPGISNQLAQEIYSTLHPTGLPN